MWYSAVGSIVPLILSLLVAPLAVEAQPTKTVPRVGYLSPGSSADPGGLRRFEAFRHGLRELGYVEGQSVALEPRWAEGKYERYPALANADFLHALSTYPFHISGSRLSGHPSNPATGLYGGHVCLHKHCSGCQSPQASGPGWISV
jgi:hypothetical protein